MKIFETSNIKMFKELGILFFLRVISISVVESSCALDLSLSEVMKCLKNVTYGVNGTNVLAGTDTHTINMFCEDGTLNQSVECLDNLYTKCGTINSLVNMAEPKTWRSAIYKLCNSLSEHAIYSTCIVHLRPKIRSCLFQNDKIFQGSLRKSDTWKTLTIKICGYFEGMRICTSKPVIEDCDAGIGNTLSDFLSSIAPKMCNPNYSHVGSQSYTNKGSMTIYDSYSLMKTCQILLILYWLTLLSD